MSLDWLIWATGFLLCLIVVIPPRKKKPVVCKLAGLTWSKEQICHNTLVTGSIGTGKTQSVLTMLDQLFEKVPGFGGLFLDHKGKDHLHLLRIAEKHGRKDDVIILEIESEGRSIYPAQRLNLLKAGAMGSSVMANILSDISYRNDVKGKNAGFFRDQTLENIDKGIQFLDLIGLPPTMTRLHQFLTSEEGMSRILDYANKKTARNQKLDEFNYHWTSNYLLQPPDQRGGVMTSIGNALAPFTPEPVAKVFSSDHPDTVDFDQINQGKIFCVLCPAALPRSKAGLDQIFKSLFFYTGKRRYDRTRFEDVDYNLLVCFLDEYQHSVAASDKDFIDTLRDANCCFIAAMQSVNSLVPVIGTDYSNVITGHFRNRFIFGCKPEECETLAGIFGKKSVWKKTYQSKGGSSRTKGDEWVISPRHFRTLKDTFCTILHTNKKWKKRVRLPMA